MVHRLVASMLFVVCQAPLPSSAGSHLWRFSEFYSSPDRAIQFIEMQEVGNSPNEHGIASHWYKTAGYNQTMTDLLDTPLPPGSTAGKKFLVGTQSYAALPGVPTPDYVIPDGAINPDGDIVTWWFYQEVTIPPATMPTDSVNSLRVTNANQFNPPPIWAIGTNTPTNFAGQTGTVVLASTIPAASRTWLALLAFGLVGLGLLAVAQSRRA